VKSAKKEATKFGKSPKQSFQRAADLLKIVAFLSHRKRYDRRVKGGLRAMTPIVHSIEDVAALLRRGLSPVTDNSDALSALGFERAYPSAFRGYQSTIWERSIEHARRHDGYRVLARERAFLI
jgi:hypothetical protein